MRSEAQHLYQCCANSRRKFQYVQSEWIGRTAYEPTQLARKQCRVQHDGMIAIGNFA